MCPKLLYLKLDFTHEWTEDGKLIDANTWRNVRIILQLFSKIRVLYCEAPEFHMRDGNNLYLPNQLQILRLCSFTEATITDFIQWLSEGVMLPHLQELAIDSDYLHLPENSIRAISIGCPSLKHLKIKYGSLAPNHVFDMVEYLSKLHHLSLGKCDVWFFQKRDIEQTAATTLDNTVSYAELIQFIALHMKNLRSLHFNQCHLHPLPLSQTSEISSSSITHAPQIQSLKIFDSSSNRPSNADVSMVMDLSDLQILRLDAPSDCKWNKTNRGKKLVNLEIRSNSKEQCENLDHQSDEYEGLPQQLQTLSLWSPSPKLLSTLLLAAPDRSRLLTRLCLNYIPDLSVLNGIKIIPLPQLKTLEIRGVSHLAGENCVHLLRLTTSDAALLRTLSVEALYRVSSNKMTLHDWVSLPDHCPLLQKISFSHLVVPSGVLASWCKENRLSNLEELKLTGPEAVPLVSNEWNLTELWPFLNSHPLLRKIQLSIGRFEKEPDERCDNMSVTFGESLRKKFWWLREVVIMGPTSINSGFELEILGNAIHF